MSCVFFAILISKAVSRAIVDTIFLSFFSVKLYACCNIVRIYAVMQIKLLVVVAAEHYCP